MSQFKYLICVLALTVGQAKAPTYWGRLAMKTKLLGLIASVALLGSLSVEPANAVTYYIDGVFATNTYDNWSCQDGSFNCPPVHVVSSVSVPLSGTVDISDGVLTGFNLNTGGENNFSGGFYGHVKDVSPDGQSWTFLYYRDYLSTLQFTATDGMLSDGLLVTGADATPWDTWQVKLTDLTGTAVVTPLPAALPLFATGLGVMGLFGWRRKRRSAAVVAAA